MSPVDMSPDDRAPRPPCMLQVLMKPGLWRQASCRAFSICQGLMHSSCLPCVLHTEGGDGAAAWASAGHQSSATRSFIAGRLPGLHLRTGRRQRHRARLRRAWLALLLCVLPHPEQPAQASSSHSGHLLQLPRGASHSALETAASLKSLCCATRGQHRHILYEGFQL